MPVVWSGGGGFNGLKRLIPEITYNTIYKISVSRRTCHFAGVVNGIACYASIERLGFARVCSNRTGDDF